jgi:hypothetical protein
MPKSRRTALFAFCIFFTALGLSQQSTEWKEYAYAEEGFAISAPVEPWIQPHYLDGGRGEGLVGHSYHFHSTRHSFNFDATRRRDIDQRTPEQVLKEAKEFYASYLGTSFKYATPAPVIYEKPISIGRYPGIEFEMQHDSFRYMGRFYVVDRMAYFLTVGTHIQVPFPKEMQRWYNSFRLIEPKEQSKTM